MSDLTTLSRRLKWLTALRSENAKRFAEETGIPYRTLQDYIAEKSKPGADHLARIAEYGCDIN